jgi:hypothetical protein
MNLDDRLKRAVDSLGDRLRDEIAKELSSLDLAPPRDETAISRLADSLRAIDYAKSLSDVLETLATAASNESARAGVFLLSGDGLRSFRLFGFPAACEDAPIELPLSRAGVLADAIQTRTVATTVIGTFDALPPDVTAVAIPLVLAGSPIGALYAEGADVPAVEILTRFASRALEALTAMKTARAVADGAV